MEDTRLHAADKEILAKHVRTFSQLQETSRRRLCCSAGSMIKGGAGGTDERGCDLNLVGTSNALMDMHLERPETLRVMSDSETRR